MSEEENQPKETEESKVDEVLEKLEDVLEQVKPIADLVLEDKPTHGLKELKEVLVVLKMFGMAAGEVFEDGKIGLEDFAALKNLVDNSSQVVDGFQGLDGAMLEAKDLDAGEAVELALEVVKAVKAIKASFE